MTDPLPEPRAALQRLLGLGDHLRRAGIPVSPARLIDLGRTLFHVDLCRREDLRNAARSALVTQREHWLAFDALFDAYWGQFAPQLPGATLAQPSSAQDRDCQPQNRLPHERTATDPESGERSEDTLACSTLDVLTHKDLGTLDEEEIRRARRMIAQLLRSLRNRPARRWRTQRGGAIDFRKSLRHAMLHDTSAFEFRYRKRRHTRPRLMLLCDVSGSMQHYSAFLLDFIYALRAELPDIQAAVFSTHMTPITAQLHERELVRSLARVAAHADGWGGGTDIGQSLAEFNRYHARTMLRRKTTVVILSDGWDRGSASRMREEIATLRQRVDKLVWLNPLLGKNDYQPLCRGIRAALPHIDHFLPAHNLASLAAVAALLRRL